MGVFYLASGTKQLRVYGVMFSLQLYIPMIHYGHWRVGRLFVHVSLSMR